MSSAPEPHATPGPAGVITKSSPRPVGGQTKVSYTALGALLAR